jgi:hypothetical protein
MSITLLDEKANERYYPQLSRTVTITEFRQLFYCQFEKNCVA